MKNSKILSAVCATGLFLLLCGSARADESALSAPIKSVYDKYLKIQASLAGDSMSDVAKNADAIAKAVRGDANALPAEVGVDAQNLAKATDLGSAREAFKPLSRLLIQYLDDQKAQNAYVQVYCPMANANWLQSDKDVKNPYLGKAMSGCGEIKN